MRNLKKILALALALVMTLSVMSFASATTYPDSDTITEKYQEAVDVLSGIKVFVGKDTGNFDPSANIKRSEVAAIIYRVVTGDVEDTNVGLYADYNYGFTDVTSDRWYAGYVNYCANAEYVKGMGNGTFKPDANVTGYQVLAMILRAVGYDQNGEFEGSGWQVRVASTARELGITDTVSEVALGQAVTREVVAELLFRTITRAHQVTYTSALGYTQYQNKGLNISDLNPTLGEDTFGLAKTEGQVSAVNRDKGTVTLLYKNKNNVEVTETITNVTTDWTNIGYEAYAYTVSDGVDSTVKSVTDTLNITGESLAVNTATTANTAHTVAPLVTGNGAIATLDTKEGYNVYFNGVKVNQYATDAAATAAENAGTLVYITGEQALKLIATENGNKVANNVAITNGTKVDFVDNDKGGEAEAIVITQYTVADVTGIANTTTTGQNAVVAGKTYLTTNARTAQLLKVDAGTTAVATDKIDADAEISVGDTVTYVVYGGYYYTHVAAVATDTYKSVSTYNYNAVSEDVYTIGDQTLVASGLTYDNALTGTDPYDALLKTKVGSRVSYVTDAYGYIIEAATVTDATTYLFGVSNAHYDGNTKVATSVVVLSDGTVPTVSVASVDGVNTMLENNVIDKHMYTYTVDGAGKYTLETANEPITTVSYGKGSATITLNGNTYYVDNASVVVDVTDVLKGTATTATVYTGKDNIPSMDTAAGYFVANNAKYVSLMFVYDINTVTDTFYMYTVNPVTVSTAGCTYNVVRDGAGSTVTLKDTVTFAYETYVENHGVGKYEIMKDGTMVYTSFDQLDKELTWANNTIVYGDSTTSDWTAYNWTDATTFTVLNITDGTLGDSFTMTAGKNYLQNATSKTYGFVTGNGKNVYVIVGEIADDTYNTSGTPKTGLKYEDAADGNTYYVMDGLITKTVANSDLAVTFYGVDAVVDSTAKTIKATVSYGTAKNHGDDGALVVTNGTPTLKATIALNVDGASYAGTVAGNDGITYNLYLTQKAAEPVSLKVLGADNKFGDNIFESDSAVVLNSSDKDSTDGTDGASATVGKSVDIYAFLTQYLQPGENDTLTVDYLTLVGDKTVYSTANGNLDQLATRQVEEIATMQITVTGEAGDIGLLVLGGVGEDVAEAVSAVDELAESLVDTDTSELSEAAATAIANLKKALASCTTEEELAKYYQPSDSSSDDSGSETPANVTKDGFVFDTDEYKAIIDLQIEGAINTLDGFADAYAAAGVDIQIDQDNQVVTVTVDNETMKKFYSDLSEDNKSNVELMISSTESKLLDLYAGIEWTVPVVNETTAKYVTAGWSKDAMGNDTSFISDDGTVYRGAYVTVANGTGDTETHQKSSSDGITFSTIDSYTKTLYFQFYTAENGVEVGSLQAWTINVVAK